MGPPAGEKTPLSARLRIRESGRKERDVPLRGDHACIGRSPEADIVLDDRAVSRIHARLHRRRDSFLIEDMGSSNGTILNGGPIPPGEYRRLRHGDRIHLGESALRFLLLLGRRTSTRLPEAPAARSEAPAEDAEEDTERAHHFLPCLFRMAKLEAALVVVGHNGIPERVPLTSDRTRIGRSEEADVVIDDPTVSKIHAEIVYTSAGFHLVDRNSALGTFLEGADVDVAPLTHRSCLRFGSRQALFVLYEEKTDPPEASFALRDHLQSAYPDRQDAIQCIFQGCREGALDLAEELVARGILTPDEWWRATRDYEESPPGARAGRALRRLVRLLRPGRFFGGNESGR